MESRPRPVRASASTNPARRTPALARCAAPASAAKGAAPRAMANPLMLDQETRRSAKSRKPIHLIELFFIIIVVVQLRVGVGVGVLRIPAFLPALGRPSFSPPLSPRGHAATAPLPRACARKPEKGAEGGSPMAEAEKAADAKSGAFLSLV